jgi:hypothetical protein
MMMVNDDSRVVSKLKALLTGDSRLRVVIYNCHMFIVQAIGLGGDKTGFVVVISKILKGDKRMAMMPIIVETFYT